MKLQIFHHGLANLNDIDGVMNQVNDFLKYHLVVNQQVIQSNNFAYIYIWYQD